MGFGPNTNARISLRWSAGNTSSGSKRVRTLSSLTQKLPTCFLTRRPSMLRCGPWRKLPSVPVPYGADRGEVEGAGDASVDDTAVSWGGGHVSRPGAPPPGASLCDTAVMSRKFRAGLLILLIAAVCGVSVCAMAWYRSRALTPAALLKRMPVEGALVAYLDFSELRRAGILQLLDRKSVV